MHDTWLGNPLLRQRPETRPRHAGALAPSPEGAEPIPLDLDLEALQTLHISRHAVIIVMPLHHPPSARGSTRRATRWATGRPDRLNRRQLLQPGLDVELASYDSSGAPCLLLQFSRSPSWSVCPHAPAHLSAWRSSQGRESPKLRLLLSGCPHPGCRAIVLQTDGIKRPCKLFPARRRI